MAFLVRCDHPSKYTSHFEEVIDRGVGQRSDRLKKLVATVDDCLDYDEQWNMDGPEDPENLNDIKAAFDAWRIGDPREFADRFASYAEAFLAELEHDGLRASEFNTVGAAFGTPPAAATNIFKGTTVDFPEDKPSHYKESFARKEWGIGRDRLQGLAEVGEKAGKVGLFAAERTLDSGVGLVPGGAAAEIAVLGATGAAAASFALPAAALAVTLLEAGLAARSWQKTEKHLLALKELKKHKDLLKGGPGWCWPGRPAADAQQVHQLIAYQILDYIIDQKETKRAKKATASFLLGVAVDVYSSYRYVKKQLHHERGVKRYKAAHWLAYHFCTCDCPLARFIVSGLTCGDEMLWLLNNGEYEGIAEFLAEKMKSV